MSNILGTPSAPDGPQVIATLALSAGGLGLSSAHKVRSAAHFPSWAGALSVVRKRHPVIAESMIRRLEVGGVPHFQAARQCREVVEPNQPRHSWQQKATRQLETIFVSDVVWPGLTDALEGVVEVPARAFSISLLSPPSFLHGQRASIVSLSVCSFAADCMYLSPVSPHLPMWPPPRRGHHRAACPEAGVLG